MARFNPPADSQGFLSFLMSAVFLLALVSSAAMFSSQKPDYRYEQLQAAHLEQLAIKKAFYSSISDAAADAFIAAQVAAKVVPPATGAEPRNAVQFAIWHRVQSVQDGLLETGYDAVFFCGQPDESAMQQASVRMQESRAAVLPAGTTQVSSISCVHSFDVDLLERKIHIFGDGFCAYSKQLGRATAPFSRPAMRWISDAKKSKRQPGRADALLAHGKSLQGADLA